MNKYIIDVGIKTKGTPLLEQCEDYTLLRNMLIGDGFHWEQSIEAKLPGEVIPFKSTVREDSDTDANVSLINRLPLETYLECVVGSEMNPSAPKEFLKAHAIISRSWAMGKVLGSHHSGSTGMEDSGERLIGWDDTAGHHGFHVCSDDHCQRYQGLQSITREAAEAIRETAGIVITTPSGEMVDARFSKCCGGRTELFENCWQPVHPPCIQSFDDPWCDLSALSPEGRRRVLSTILKDYDLATDNYGFRWEAAVSKKDVKKNLKDRFGRSVGEIISLRPLHRGPSGRIDLLEVTGSEGNLEIGKELWIRRLLSPSHLYSSAFTIEDTGDSFLLKGRGWGHGAGLCQIGAANMALHGQSYSDILSFYYPGSILSSLDQ